MKKTLIALHLIFFLFSCQEKYEPIQKLRASEQPQQRKTIPLEFKNLRQVLVKSQMTYKLESSEKWLLNYQNDTIKERIVFALNRTDKSHFARMDSVVVPLDYSQSLTTYLPFPLAVEFLKDINKIIFFSYPTQTFATYENGRLIHTGPTNMGSEQHTTPTGLYFTNWKAKVKISTVDDEWVLNWNFNVLNYEGIGWHEYGLPGYPASHSCLRLQEKDAKYLYYWADQWILKESTILVKGTPVVIFGEYDFASPKPWLKLVSNPNALDITREEMEELTKPYLDEILAAQKIRESFLAEKQSVPIY